MFWIALLSGIVNAVFILDLMVTMFTGAGLGTLLTHSDENSVAKAIIANIPTDPATFWILSGFILAVVIAIECLLVYLAFYSDPDRCACDMTGAGSTRGRR